MKHSQRRQMIGNLAAVFAVPLTFGRLPIPEPIEDSGSNTAQKRRPATNDSSIRPRIAAPKGSVVRRG